MNLSEDRYYDSRLLIFFRYSYAHEREDIIGIIATGPQNNLSKQWAIEPRSKRA